MNYFPESSGPYGKKTIKNSPFHLIRRIVAELRIMIFDPNGSISKTSKCYEQWTEEVFSPYCEEFDLKLINLIGTDDLTKLINLAEELDQEMITHYRLVRYGIPVHNIGMNLMAQYLITKFLGEKEARHYFPILMSGLENKLTETNDRIHNLDSIIQKSSELTSLILENNSDELYNLISTEKTPVIKSFFNEFEKFLKDFGDRGFTREAFYPRWRDAPQYVFDIFKALISEQKSNIDKIKAKNIRKREIIERIVEIKVRSQRLGLLKWKIFSKILNYSRTYTIFRENQRFNLDRWITRNRRLYLEIGKMFAKNGILTDKTEIFFLKKQEVRSLSGKNVNDINKKIIYSLLNERKDEFLKYENIIPPKFLHGSKEFDDPIQFTRESKFFQGIPASQGVITAPVRVLNIIEDIPSVRAGEILVVPRTDPGWTPVFSNIGGVITETGGILSHGAVVAREYGIPAVTNIPNACQLLQTGQIVTINGYNGKIILKR